MTEQAQQKQNHIISSLKTLFTMAIGAFIWHMISYFRRIWRQPSLFTRPIDEPRTQSEVATLIEQALAIATSDVREGIEERILPNGQRKAVLCAGWRNFREPWARDFGFASFGLVELSEVRALKETLELFLHYQRENGRFPVKVHSTNLVERYLHSLFNRQQPIANPLRPKYHTAHNSVSLDGNSLLVIAALNYLRHYDDADFAATHWEALKRALNWIEAQALSQEDGLLHQGAYTDWADSVARIGAVHYTNVLYWKAAREFARDAQKYGYTADATYFAAQEQKIAQAINDHFWDDQQGFYVTSHQYPAILNSDGNLLAIAWGLASSQQAQTILDNMRRWNMAYPAPTQATNQDYGRNAIALENRLAGIPHYHTSAAWLWLGGWHVIAAVRAQRLTEAQELLERMAALIARDGVVHEVYNKRGNHLSTFWYESEAPLTWSASMFIYAQSVYERAAADH